MTEHQRAAAARTIAGVLGQVVTMAAESVTYAPRGDGAVARVRVAGGDHEIVCELTAEGDLLSARVIEL